MNLSENIREATKSIKENLLRTSLTASIIAIGIMALVGILTAIDAIEYSVTSGLAQLGGNSFDIRDVSRGRRQGGVLLSTKSQISYEEAQRFRERYTGGAVSLSTMVSGSVEAKHLSKKTNPNSRLMGVDQYFLDNKGLNLQAGRNFSPIELQEGAQVAVIGSEIAKTLFDKENPIGKVFGMIDRKYLIIGVLDASGGLGGGRDDRSILIPIENGYRVAGSQRLYYTITVSGKTPQGLDYAMGEATGLMRLVRKDALGEPDSFDVSRSESVADSLREISTSLRLGGGLISFVTLIGASIGLMNIMMVSVTERTREIGVRKALGATPSRIRQQFLIEAIVICLLGGAFGIVLGIVGGNLVTAIFGNLVFVIPWVWIITGLVVCVVVGISSGYIPARKASRLDPIESLRYE
jgi:putative ABC transport system permease protein